MWEYYIKQMLHMEVGWSECDNIYDSGNNIILEKETKQYGGWPITFI